MERFTIVSSNKKYYEEEVRRVKCPRYDPCPICYKCRSKASHLYLKCQECKVPPDGHTEEHREFMIRRENFSPKLPL